MIPAATFRLGGDDFVILSKADYRWLLSDRRGPPPGSVDALVYATQSLAANLKKAREAGGLTQAELAAKLDVGQSAVSMAERAKMRVGERYVRAVLKACGLPQNWTAGGRSKTSTSPSTKGAGRFYPRKKAP
jgi:ribosome-binding protein aMBF1 (putative translation factor)